MSGPMRKFYSPRVFDCLFAVAGLLSVGLISLVGEAYPAIVASSDPMTKSGALLVVLGVSSLLAVVATRFDQKKADNFLFLTLIKSAYIAIATFIFTAALWGLLLADKLGQLSSHVMLIIMVASWSLAYLYVRLRGTGQSA